MTFTFSHALSLVIVVLGLACVVSAVYSLAKLITCWRTTQRRGHATRLAIAIAIIPCLVGCQYAVIYCVFLPALAREHMKGAEQRQAQQLVATSVVLVGDAAPAFEITDVDGKVFSLADMKGKAIVVNFFAPWCRECRVELPHIQKLWQDYGDRDDFALLVIGREESDKSVRDLRAKLQYTFPIAADPERAVCGLFVKELIPRTFVIGRNGLIAYSQLGFVEADVEGMTSAVERELTAK